MGGAGVPGWTWVAQARIEDIAVGSQCSPWLALYIPPQEQCVSGIKPVKTTLLFTMLPTEVLSQILQHAPRNSKNHSGLVIARESPLFLAHVSSHWRSTAFSIPDIWSFIDLNLTNTTRTNLLQLHLSLSARASLSIALVSNHDDPDIIQPFIRTLLPHFPRCQSLYIHLPGPLLIELERLVSSSNLGDIPQSLSNLRDLTIHVNGDTPSSRRQDFYAISKAPLLSSVTIWCSSHYMDYIHLPSSQLTHLNVSLPPQAIFWLLYETSHVTECHLYCLDTQSNSFNEDYLYGVLPMLKLTHLRSLHISGTYDGDVLLNLIVAPALESFSCLLYSVRHNPFNIIMRTPTTKLTTSEELFAFLGSDSKLEYVRELRIRDWSEPVDQLLEDDDLILPSLEALIIHLYNGQSYRDLRFHDDLLLDLIASRMPGNINPDSGIAYIKSVTFIDADAGARLSDESRHRLEEMQMKGLEVVFVESEIPWVWSGKAPELRRLEF